VTADEEDGARTRELERQLALRDALLRQVLTQRGEALLSWLEEARARAFEAAQARRRDPATGLLRHGYFRTRLAFEVDRGQRAQEPLGLVLLDLDGFATLNRVAGYERGEEALGLVGGSLPALWIARPSRRPPVLGREGGDSFGVILPGEGRAETAARAEEIWRLVDSLSLGTQRLSASVGAIAFTSRLLQADKLLAITYLALERARRQGGNQVVFEEL